MDGMGLLSTDSRESANRGHQKTSSPFSPAFLEIGDQRPAYDTSTPVFNLRGVLNRLTASDGPNPIGELYLHGK